MLADSEFLPVVREPLMRSATSGREETTPERGSRQAAGSRKPGDGKFAIVSVCDQQLLGSPLLLEAQPLAG